MIGVQPIFFCSKAQNEVQKVTLRVKSCLFFCPILKTSILVQAFSPQLVWVPQGWQDGRSFGRDLWHRKGQVCILFSFFISLVTAICSESIARFTTKSVRAVTVKNALAFTTSPSSPRPSSSPTCAYAKETSCFLLLIQMYLNPIAAPMIDAEGKPVEYDKKYLRDHFEDFYEDAFEELSKFGEIEVHQR